MYIRFTHGDLAAVVSDTPIVIYDPTRENVLAHEFVNETVMREFTVIPMSFGTVFRSEEDVGELLRSTYDAFTDVLEKMRDKIEFGVQIRWDRDRVVESIEGENDEIRRLKDEITRNAASSTYFARMQLGRLIEGALEELRGRYVAAVHDELRKLSVASRSNKVIGDRMILNAAFLVNRSEEKAFDDAVKELSRRFEHLLTSSTRVRGRRTISSTSSSSSRRRTVGLLAVDPARAVHRPHRRNDVDARQGAARG